jgi:Zn-dependent peptidase ImmA (M78 family)
MKKRGIKEKADALRAKAGQNKAPINVQVIAKVHGLVVSLRPFKPEMSGVLVKEEGGRIVIGVNSAHSPTRQRFTIAHELGHYALGHPGEIFVDQVVRAQGVTIGRRRDRKSTLGVDPYEIEANAFGAEVLMPEDLVLEAVRKQLRNNENIAPEQLSQMLARQFQVSPEAMQHRLANLGLLIPQ